MFDNDHFTGRSQEQQHPFSMTGPSDPFQLNKQGSISEIAPETQRTYNPMMIRRGSEDNIYGFVMEEDDLREEEEEPTSRERRDDECIHKSARTDYEGGRHGIMSTYTKEQLTNLINPVNNTTTDFYTEEDERVMKFN